MSTPKVKRNKGDEPTKAGSSKALKDSEAAESPRPPVDRSKKPKPKDAGTEAASGNDKSSKSSKSKLNGAEADVKDVARDDDDSDSDSSSEAPAPRTKKSPKPKAKVPSSDSEESDEESSESEKDPKPAAKQPTKKPSAKLPTQPDSPATKRSSSGRASSQTSLPVKKGTKEAKKGNNKQDDSSSTSSDDDSAIVESEDDRPDVATEEDLLDPDSSEEEDESEEKPKPKPKKLASSTTGASSTSKGDSKPSGKRTKESPRGGKGKGADDTDAIPKKKPIAVSTDNTPASSGSKRDKKHATPAPGEKEDETDSAPFPESDGDDKKPEAKPDEAKKPKSGGFFASFFGKKKNDSDKAAAPARTEQQRERKVIMVASVADLSEDIQKKLKKAKIPDEKLQKNLKVLLNVLHFLTKDSYRTPGEDKDPPRERRPYATASMIDGAKAMVQIPDNIKKYYRSIEFSGKGGFGRVFAAKDVATKRRVAIKRVPHVTEKDKRNNYCEIAFLSQCKHPNVVNFIRAWEVKDEAWIVTEFLEGGTLSEAVKVHQFSERHIAYVAREILKALKYLHSIDFVHRDLKSGNVMMSIEGHIKLIDFGLCCEVGSGPRVQMLGSPYWIPPEMIKRKPHACPADIWSFAVCVLEMFLKEPPNASSRLYAMFTAAADGIQDAIPPKASPMAKDFLSKCLIINPAKRASAEELLQHPFVTQPKLEEGIKDVLRGVFVSNSLALSGI